MKLWLESWLKYVERNLGNLLESEKGGSLVEVTGGGVKVRWKRCGEH